MKLKRQRQRKILISVFTLICAIVLLVLFFAVGSLIRENAVLTFADGKILIAETQNGGLDISWPVAEGASSSLRTRERDRQKRRLIFLREPIPG